MKKSLIWTMTALLLSSPTLPAWAGADAPAGHDMDKMSGMDMGGDKSAMLDSVQLDGVTAKPHLMDVREAMAQHGMKETHHLMVMFTDSQSGKPITVGAVAVKVIDPAGVKGEPVKMVPMGDGFGADVALAAPGKYSFEVGTKLADAKKRIFTFSYGK